ncbi:flagellar hook-length control protein FliK [Variovorax boronicumulans]|uniref:Flagellar hook-length control protein FliK n=1 Tax=Variovorax boronicumulans TaxID=436515 RepID=A0A250DFQ1_9BURK|nr:flagellar hook-length control protein FliK [Variovorax boronicumulans]ATA53205.1 flagellar hook-length control protein FliK [Variovorax boronicumulans]
MPPMIPPSVTPAATSPVAQGGARGRSNADETQGRAFGAALERSRASQAEKASDADTVVADAKPLRKTDLAEEVRDAQPAEPDLAFLAAAVTPQQALVLAGGAATQGSGAPETSLAPVTPDVQAGLPAGTVRLSSDAAATPAPAIATEDASAPTATVVAQGAAAEADNAAPPSLYEIVRAAVAAQPMAVDGKKPAAAPAGPAVGTAASGRAAAPRTVSATTTEQLAAAAQAQPAADAKPVTAEAAPVAAVPATASSDDAATPAASFALQQPAATSTERTTESPVARPAVHTLAPEVGSEKWAPALGQQLARMSLGGTHTAELNLNPAGLGPLKVTLSVGEHQAQAAFVSAHESVRKAVEAALPQLRTSLSEQGITLGQTSVGADTRAPFGQDAAFAQQQQQQHQRQGAWRPQGTSAATDIARTTTAAPRPVATPRTGPGVDTFA